MRSPNKGRRRGEAIPVLEVDRNRIKTAREAHGYTQEQLAGMVGTKREYVSRLENGGVRSTPLLRTFYRRLGLDPELINKHDPDIERAIEALYELKRSEHGQRAADAHIRYMVEDADSLRALRERREEEDREAEAIVRRALERRTSGNS